ncbi:MAG TPA: hypothetical protein PKY22_07725, partial [Accumulibacter sp.]|nr:hypothetical protein [Accumulibacter sp.]
THGRRRKYATMADNGLAKPAIRRSMTVCRITDLRVAVVVSGDDRSATLLPIRHASFVRLGIAVLAHRKSIHSLSR